MKRYVEEAESNRVRREIREGWVATSRITAVEVTSALYRRAREGAITEGEREEALLAVTRDFLELYVVELTTQVVATSRQLLGRHKLRAADAVQLASCLELGRALKMPVGFMAFDVRLLEAARAEGLETLGAARLEGRAS